jgi:hypothetical protein
MSDSEIHSVPVNDLIEHEISEDCVCGPTVEYCNPGWHYMHHSLDNREKIDTQSTT